MPWFNHFTEGLANLNLKTILMAVGIMATALAGFRLAPRSRNRDSNWLAENVQVILSVVVVVFLIIRPFLFQAFYIPSGSMEPTLMGPHPIPGGQGRQTSGDRLLVNKLVYRMSDPKRFDIVVFKAPPQASPDEKEFIKRVIGLPGETIEVVSPRLMVDGRPVVTLSAEGLYGGASLQDRLHPEASIHPDRAELIYATYPFKVLAIPDANVSYAPNQVMVNGQVELADPNAQILEDSGLAAYGADPGVQAKVYSIQGTPRLAVVSGKALAYDPGHVLANGKRLLEKYVMEPPDYSKSPIRLAANEYFMMGDNRNNSNDSHAWGPLTRDRVIGRAEIVFWPTPRFSVLDWWLISLFGGVLLGYNLLYRLLSRKD